MKPDQVIKLLQTLNGARDVRTRRLVTNEDVWEVQYTKDNQVTRLAVTLETHARIVHVGDTAEEKVR